MNLIEKVVKKDIYNLTVQVDELKAALKHSEEARDRQRHQINSLMSQLSTNVEFRVGSRYEFSDCGQEWYESELTHIDVSVNFANEHGNYECYMRGVGDEDNS